VGGALASALLTGLLITVGVGWILGVLLQVVLGTGTPLFDGPIHQFFVQRREAWLTSTMQVITLAGDSSVVMWLVIGLGLMWWWRTRSPRPVALLVATYAGARVIETLVKFLTHRPRPLRDEALGDFTNFAFPSGHAIYAMTVYGMLAILLVRASWPGKRKVLLLLIMTGVICLISTSRVYLGAHWLTDVMGGIALGGLWLICLITLTTVVDSWWAKHSDLQVQDASSDARHESLTDDHRSSTRDVNGAPGGSLGASGLAQPDHRTNDV
jgi:membrane-associated phospholipid phosphatase